MAEFPTKNSGAVVELPFCPKPIVDEVLGLRAVDGETGLKADLSAVDEDLDECAISAR
jgi:hypothetical protein